MTNKKECVIVRELSKEQADLLDLCLEIGYGKIQEIIVRDGQPVYVTTVKSDRKLG